MKVKNIVFSGVMGAILMSATGASAAISVASQGYVDAKVGAVSTSVSDLSTTVSNTYQTKADAATAASGVQTALDGKADKATTLAGYGIGDAYTKTEADEKYLIMENADVLGANLQWTAEGKLDTKGIATAEGLDELDERVNGNASTEGSVAYDIAAALTEAKGYTDAEVKELAEGAVATNAAAIEVLQSNKADAADVYTKTEADEKFELAGSAAAVDAKLADYTKTVDLDSGFVSETEMTTFKADNTAAIEDAKKAGTDAADAAAAAKTAADEAQADADANASAITQLQADLATKISAPAACEKQDCVLSINKASGTVSWVPLTEPVNEFLN